MRLTLCNAALCRPAHVPPFPAALTKLSGQEDALTKRLQELEAKVTGSVADAVSGRIDASLTERLAKLEQLVNQQLDRRLAQDLPTLETRLLQSTATSSRSWMLPFAGLAVLLLVAGAVAFNRYRFLLKRSHIL